MKDHKTNTRTIVTTLIVLVVVVGGIVLAIHNVKPAKLTANTPTPLNMGGVYTITVPCLASGPNKSYNPSGLDATEYTSSCSTNIPNNIVGANSSGDSYSNLPPSISYDLSSYSGTGSNVPLASICNGTSFNQTESGVQFGICEEKSNGSVYEISAIASKGTNTAQIVISAGIGNTNLPSNALSDLYGTLETFQFMN